MWPFQRNLLALIFLNSSQICLTAPKPEKADILPEELSQHISILVATDQGADLCVRSLSPAKGGEGEVRLSG